MQSRAFILGILAAALVASGCTRISPDGATRPDLSKRNARIVVTTTMFTPGGSHSEIEIPEILNHLRSKHPHVTLRYAWPFDLQQVATMLADQLRRFA